ncbi:MAG: integrase core domain-containing protein [Gemmobacter sp.]
MRCGKFPDDRKSDWHAIAAGKSTRKAFIESFNCRLHDAFPNETLLPSLHHARATLAAWRIGHSTEAPDPVSAGKPPPRSPGTSNRNGACRCATRKPLRQFPPRQPPLADPPKRASLIPGVSLRLDGD